MHSLTSFKTQGISTSLFGYTSTRKRIMTSTAKGERTITVFSCFCFVGSQQLTVNLTARGKAGVILRREPLVHEQVALTVQMQLTV